MSQDDEQASPTPENEELFVTETEREWSETPSVGGVDPELMDARRVQAGDEEAITEEDIAAFSPLLLPMAAVLTGPLVASFLALFCDGDPPTGRQAIALLATGATAWLINMGLMSSGEAWVSLPVSGSIRMAVLLISGFILWALYAFWMRGPRLLDRSALGRSVVLVVVLSLTFWLGRDMDWWIWMGR